MTIDLHPIGNGVNSLKLGGVTLLSLDDVDAWLFAIDVPQGERNAACWQIMTKGYHAVSNIEYRVTVGCTKQ